MVQSKQEAEKLLKELQGILYKKDTELQEQVISQVTQVRERLEDESTFKDRLDPYLEEQLQYLQQNFPALFGKYLGTAIKVQIRDSQDEIIDALYPIMGKLITRFVKAEMERISERIDTALKNPFSFKNLKLRLKALFSGVSYDELLIRQNASDARLEEIFVIRNLDGLLLGHFSFNEISHPDMVAGMLTGIKQFMEHAFEKGEQELQTLSYDRYTILIYNFHTYYFAVVEDGVPNSSYQEKVRESIYEFCDKQPIHFDQAINKAQVDQLSLALKEYFHGFNQVDQ